MLRDLEGRIASAFSAFTSSAFALVAVVGGFRVRLG